MMLAKSVCSKCGCKYKTVETRYGERKYAVYRYKECPICGDSVFTREHITKDTIDFRKKWNYNSRAAQDWRDQKKQLRRLMRVAKSLTADGVAEDYQTLKQKYEALVASVGREPTEEEIAEMSEQEED